MSLSLYKHQTHTHTHTYACLLSRSESQRSCRKWKWEWLWEVVRRDGWWMNWERDSELYMLRMFCSFLSEAVRPPSLYLHSHCKYNSTCTSLPETCSQSHSSLTHLCSQITLYYIWCLLTWNSSNHEGCTIFCDSEREIAQLVSDLRLCVLNAAPYENSWWRFTANHRTVFTDEMRMTIACNISCSPSNHHFFLGLVFGYFKIFK